MQECENFDCFRDDNLQRYHSVLVSDFDKYHLALLFIVYVSVAIDN